MNDNIYFVSIERSEMQNIETKYSPEDMLPLNPIVFNILSVLLGKTKHGYEIMKNVEADMEKAVPTATLYRHLRTMRDDHLIQEVDQPTEGDDPRRQYFKMTAHGQAVYVAEYNRLRKLLLNEPVGEFEKGYTTPFGVV